MKGIIRVLALTLGISAAAAFSGIALACVCGNGGQEYYDPVTGADVYVGGGLSYYGSYYNAACGTNCINVPAHKYNGHHYKAQKVCYKGGYYNSTILCGWVHGYWKHKMWIPGHTICWKY